MQQGKGTVDLEKLAASEGLERERNNFTSSMIREEDKIVEICMGGCLCSSCGIIG